MPAIVGNVNINSNAGTVNFGSTLAIAPTSILKAISGQGGANTGNVVNVLNGTNINNTLDPDLIDNSAATGVL